MQRYEQHKREMDEAKGAWVERAQALAFGNSAMQVDSTSPTNASKEGTIDSEPPKESEPRSEMVLKSCRITD